MYCSKCGSELSDGAVFSPHCGNKIINTGDSPALENREYIAPTAATVSKSRKPFKLALIIIIPILVIAGLVLKFNVNKSGGNRTPEKLAENYIEAYYNLDSAKLVSCLPDFAVVKNAEYLGLSDSSRKTLIKALEERAKTSGEQKRNVKIISIKTDNVLSVNYDVFDFYGLSSSEKSKISEVLDLEVKYSLDDSDIENMEIICFKQGKNWYFLDMD